MSAGVWSSENDGGIGALGILAFQVTKQPISLRGRTERVKFRSTKLYLRQEAAQLGLVEWRIIASKHALDLVVNEQVGIAADGRSRLTVGTESEATVCTRVHVCLRCAQCGHCIKLLQYTRGPILRRYYGYGCGQGQG
jgi:hypothetical protein